MEKVCLYCAKTFDAKRSDAVYCSNECKNKANYEKKRALLKQPFPEQTDLPGENCIVENIPPKNGRVTIKGSLTIHEVRAEIQRAESKITDCETRRKELVEINAELHRQLTNIKRKMRIIEQLGINRLKRRIELADEQLYNLYLNREYLKAKQEGNEFAHNRIVPFEQHKIPERYKLPIDEFRLKLVDAIARKNEELKTLEENATILMKDITLNQYEVKKIEEDVRFLQGRILKYDSLLIFD